MNFWFIDSFLKLSIVFENFFYFSLIRRLNQHMLTRARQ